MEPAADTTITVAVVTTVSSGKEAGTASTPNAPKCVNARTLAVEPNDANSRTVRPLSCRLATKSRGTAPAAATATGAATVTDAANGKETGIANTSSAARSAKTKTPVQQPDSERSKLIQRDIEPCALKRTRQRGSFERRALPIRSLRRRLACRSTGNALKCAPNDASTCDALKCERSRENATGATGPKRKPKPRLVRCLPSTQTDR